MGRFTAAKLVSIFSRRLDRLVRPLFYFSTAAKVSPINIAEIAETAAMHAPLFPKVAPLIKIIVGSVRFDGVPFKKATLPDYFSFN